MKKWNDVTSLERSAMASAKGGRKEKQANACYDPNLHCGGGNGWPGSAVLAAMKATQDLERSNS